MQKQAPIALFVYKRLEHTQKVIQSLLDNDTAKNSTIFIFSDSAKSEKDNEQVKKVREYIKRISGFKNVEIIFRDKNLGLAGSIISGVSVVIETYGKVVVIEDDLILSPYFLEFMNKGLEIYENVEEVISIHGYIYPLKKLLPETFFLKGADCWGWATWKRGWDLFEQNAPILLDEIYHRMLENEFDLNGAVKNIKMLKKQIKGENDSWAIRWHASAFLKNKYTLYPGRSLVQNIGMGKQSTHTKKTNVYNVELSPKPIKVEEIEVKENEFVKKEIEKYFRSIRTNLFHKLVHFFV
ncbi:MAG: glycosyl transferase [Ignavibacteria bacterium RIFOXYB2_FULL_35_12]|nr:MAG: glycosyl transferase [Ignavibacteria bacterium GWA2_36_19]OGU62647.1 MAG: glycosyl transferase [Ignavibacteria bacterium GWF2_35_20]OGU82764.1 MAG: glycosyl transferase [Ignavibacteria bacterium RIFOXYA2_FULL_35_9]OGU88928.1 MAG: glycosyl transferase [Ignavibacteria bacterium RIFOXYC12_FULL_35_11]OGU89548.1 MAG: glycosyl transferase [Ignavibacteria bacterium RIFOXYA12_FULL_35_25]OGU94616.1 MAG: glycosyl transferase [Ignavibacteria bacterium RIFOXYB12_FULL_35_14]OGV01604.1 MAG: glycosy